MGVNVGRGPLGTFQRDVYMTIPTDSGIARALMTQNAHIGPYSSSFRDKVLVAAVALSKCQLCKVTGNPKPSISICIGAFSTSATTTTSTATTITTALVQDALPSERTGIRRERVCTITKACAPRRFNTQCFSSELDAYADNQLLSTSMAMRGQSHTLRGLRRQEKHQ